MTYSEIYENAVAKATAKHCPECGCEGTLQNADDEVLVCKNCNYSVDAIDLQSEWQNKIEINEGFFN